MTMDCYKLENYSAKKLKFTPNINYSTVRIDVIKISKLITTFNFSVIFLF